MKKLFLSLLLLCSGMNIQAALQIEITEGVESAEPIAIVPFGWKGQGPRPPQDIAQIVNNNLRMSGHFSPLPVKDMLARPTELSQVKYKNWRILEQPYLVIGQVTELPGNKYNVEFRLLDVYKGAEIAGETYKVPRSLLRSRAHQISDIIFKELTGIRGAFDTKLAFVKKMPKSTNPKFRYWLFMSDSDTENEEAILRSRKAIISPTWSRDANKLAFAVIRKNGQSIYYYDRRTRKKGRLTLSNEKFSAPAWSPDGSKLAMVKLHNGSSDVYIMDLKSRKKKRITKHWAIDTEPTWSIDGKSLVFTSDRGGRPQLYEYNLASKRVQRLTFEGKENLRASFSPDGSMITFVHLSRDGQYHVGLLDMQTRQMSLLTKATYEESEHESPSFAPNGGMVIYAANYQNKRGVLATVSVDGRVHKRFMNKQEAGEVREPAWSPFLN